MLMFRHNYSVGLFYSEVHFFFLFFLANIFHLGGIFFIQFPVQFCGSFLVAKDQLTFFFFFVKAKDQLIVRLENGLALNDFLYLFIYKSKFIIYSKLKECGEFNPDLVEFKIWSCIFGYTTEPNL